MPAMHLINNALNALSEQLLNLDKDFISDNKFEQNISTHHQIPSLNWGIFGEVSSGKTTLLNTLIEHNYLPTGCLSTTATTVHIVSANNYHSKGTVILERYCKDDYFEMLKWLFQHVHVNSTMDGSIINYANNIIDNEALQVDYSLEIDAIKRVLFSINNYNDDLSIKIILEDLEDQITDTDLLWKKVTIYLDTKWSDYPIEWIDTPGFGHHDILHRWIAEKALNIVDKAFFLVEPRGVSKECHDFLQQIPVNKQKQVILIFSRIDEFQDEENVYAWNHYAKKIVAQINWQGHYFGISALCTQFARKMQKVELTSKEIRQFEKVAIIPEPLNPEENLKLSGVTSLEKVFIKKQIAHYLTLDIKNYCTKINLQLETIKQEILQQKEERYKQEQLSIDNAYSSILRNITDEQKKYKSTINKCHNKSLHAYKLCFNKLDRIWATESKLLFKLIGKYELMISREISFGEIANSISHKMENPLPILFKNLMSFVFKLFEPTYQIPPLDTNSRKFDKGKMSLKQDTGLSYEDYLRSENAANSPFSLFMHDISIPYAVRKQGIGYIADIIEQKNKSDRDWFSNYQKHSIFCNKKKSLQYDLTVWKRFTRRVINKQYNSEIPELLKEVTHSIQANIEFNFKDIETNINNEMTHHNTALNQISAIQASIECLLNLTNKSYELS